MTNEYEMVDDIFHGQEGDFSFFCFVFKHFFGKSVAVQVFFCDNRTWFLRRLRRVIWRD